MLGKSSEWITDSLVSLGIKLRINKFILGLVVLGLATSAPELLVAVNAIATKVLTLSLGNVLGASFVLLTLVAGLSILLNKQINIFRAISFKELLIVDIVIAMPAILILDGMLSRIDGITLIVVYGSYLGYMITRKNIVNNTVGLISNNRGKNAAEHIGFLIFGLLIMILAAKYAVDVGVKVALDLGISPLIVGLLAFSVGTNLPELAIAFETRKSYKKYILFGDLLGSSAANSLVIGLVAFFQPFAVSNMSAIYLITLFLVGGLAAFNITALTQSKMIRQEGILLIGIYVLFVVAAVLLNIL